MEPKHVSQNQSHQSFQYKKNFCDESQNEEETDPDKDRVSDEEVQRACETFYYDGYESECPSKRSSTPSSQSMTPPRTRRREVSDKTGGVARRGGVYPQHRDGRPPTKQHRKGGHLEGKQSSPSKGLNLVAKTKLSTQMIKIDQLSNALVDLQRHTDELQRENQTLRKLHLRQERALQRFSNTEMEISQLLARHTNETRVLREHLRRTQERGRASERHLRDNEEQLHKSQATIARLRKLVDQRELGTRDELSRKLEREKVQVQQAEQKIKELEHKMELSTSSYKRQLAAERKKTVSAQKEIKTQKEEMEQLTNKFKEKEKELYAKIVYTNRTIKRSERSSTDNGPKQKGSGQNCTKAAPTEDGLSEKFIRQAGDGHSQQEHQTMQDREEFAREKARVRQHPGREGKEPRPGGGGEKDQEDRERTGLLLNQDEENNRNDRDDGAVGGAGRRAPKSLISNEDLAFGNYAMCFGNPASRGLPVFPSSPPKEDGDSALEAIGVFSLRVMETEKEKEAERGVEKDRKSHLMQQLFESMATPASDSVSGLIKTKVLSCPPATHEVCRGTS